MHYHACTCRKGTQTMCSKHAHAKEIKSHEDHCIILWINIPTQGVLSAAKSDYMITSVSNLLSTYRKNAVAIFVHCNRAGDPARTLIFAFRILKPLSTRYQPGKLSYIVCPCLPPSAKFSLDPSVFLKTFGESIEQGGVESSLRRSRRMSWEMTWTTWMWKRRGMGNLMEWMMKTCWKMTPRMIIQRSPKFVRCATAWSPFT